MANQIKPLKKFGQNFLQNKYYIEKIVKALDCKEDDIILEIGAGRGALTDVLVRQTCSHITVLEIDTRLVEFLREKYSSMTNVIKTSILDFSLTELSKNKQIKVIGNIPYNITSQILFKIIDNRAVIKRAVLMVQKEVADRLLAETRTKEYGILSVFIQSLSEVKRLFDITRDNFYPVPKVDSSVISIDLKSDNEGIEDYQLFKKIVKTSFQSRRKMLRNSLKKILNAWGIDNINSISLEVRPEELSAEQFKILSNTISNTSKK
jgi:16S rRNA (adenine1518-N6/adenine1519-N6)-dimethyltransferase